MDLFEDISKDKHPAEEDHRKNGRRQNLADQIAVEFANHRLAGKLYSIRPKVEREGNRQLFEILGLIHLTNPNFSANLSAESAACLVVAAVFKTVEAQFGLGGFNSFPLRHHLIFS